MYNSFGLKMNKTINNMLKLTSNKTGIINNIDVSKAPYSFDNKILGNIIPVYYSNAIISKGYFNSKFNSHFKKEGIVGAGASLSKEKSMMKAVGECLERYCACFYNEELMTYASVDELNDTCLEHINPRTLTYFSDEQYNSKNFMFKKYADNKKIYWVRAFSNTYSKWKLVPAQKIFLDHRYAKKPEEPLDWAISTGLACGDSLYKAALSSIYENIERDAFCLTWRLCIPGKKIIIDRIKNKNLSNLYSKIKNGLLGDLYIFDISKDINVYTILVVLVNNEAGSIAKCVACASNLDPELAILKSLDELLLSNRKAYSLIYEDTEAKYFKKSKEEIRSLNDHFEYYFEPKCHDKAFEFLFKNKDEILLSKLKNYSTLKAEKDFNLCKDELKNIGIETLTIDLSLKNISEYGFYVTKVINPGLENLDVAYNHEHIAGRRLTEYRNKYGLKLNENPHPFP